MTFISLPKKLILHWPFSITLCVTASRNSIAIPASPINIYSPYQKIGDSSKYPDKNRENLRIQGPPPLSSRCTHCFFHVFFLRPICPQMVGAFAERSNFPKGMKTIRWSYLFVNQELQHGHMWPNMDERYEDWKWSVTVNWRQDGVGMFILRIFWHQETIQTSLTHVYVQILKSPW